MWSCARAVRKLGHKGTPHPTGIATHCVPTSDWPDICALAACRADETWAAFHNSLATERPVKRVRSSVSSLALGQSAPQAPQGHAGSSHTTLKVCVLSVLTAAAVRSRLGVWAAALHHATAH